MKHARGSWFNVVASVTGVLICVGLPSASARPQQSPYALACNRNHSLTGYTFRARTHHSGDAPFSVAAFPYFRHRTERARPAVHSALYEDAILRERVPYDRLTIALRSGATWKSRYSDRRPSVASKRLDDHVTAPLPRGTNRERQNQLRVAYVTLDAKYATRAVVLYYRNGGSITLNLTPGSTSGYWLPASGVAQINMPGEALSAPLRLCHDLAQPFPSEPLPPTRGHYDAPVGGRQTRVCDFAPGVRQGGRRPSDLFWRCLHPRFFDFALGRNVCTGALSRTFYFLH